MAWCCGGPCRFFDALPAKFVREREEAAEAAAAERRRRRKAKRGKAKQKHPPKAAAEG